MTIDFAVATADEIAQHLGVDSVQITVAPSYDDAILDLQCRYRSVTTTSLGGAVKCDCVGDGMSDCIILR